MSLLVMHRNRKSNTVNWQILTIDQKELIGESAADVFAYILSPENEEEFADVANIVKGKPVARRWYEARAA